MQNSHAPARRTTDLAVSDNRDPKRNPDMVVSPPSPAQSQNLLRFFHLCREVADRSATHLPPGPVIVCSKRVTRVLGHPESRSSDLSRKTEHRRHASLRHFCYT